SSDGQSIVFMDCPIIFEFDINDPSTHDFSMQQTCADVYTIPFGGFFPWSRADAVQVVPDEYEIFPDYGRGPTVPTYNDPRDNGDEFGQPIPQGLSSLTIGDDIGFTLDERQDIARELGEASIALRVSLGFFVTDDQDWRLKDLPAVPEHTVKVLQQIADIVCFRDPIVSYDPRHQPPDPLPVGWEPAEDPPLQTYPGRININTATRPVLRTIFLLMFDGSEIDADGDGEPNSPCPRVDDNLTSAYLNLKDPNLNDDELRFQAIVIADR
ncbi:unnamed protein product, partial [marine sediment metagenome]